MQRIRVLRAGSSHTLRSASRRGKLLLLVDRQRSSRSRPDIVLMPARFLLQRERPCGESPTSAENWLGQVGNFLNLTASKFGIHMWQHADRLCARDSGVAIGGKPIVKAIGDR